MTALPPCVTGSVPFHAGISLPSWNNLHRLDLRDSQVAWSGCLDAVDRIPAGSTFNFKTSDGRWVVGASFDFRSFYF